MNSITVELNRPQEREDFALEDRNLAQVRVRLASGEWVSGSQHLVELALSRDAMIGLATELLRAAHSEPFGFTLEVHPVEREFASQCLGIHLSSDSCELIVASADLGTVSESMSRANAR
jgi:hypothetical protein